MKVLVTGATGFVGMHMMKELHSRGIEAYPLSGVDVRYFAEVEEVIQSLRPDTIVHLAGVAHVHQGSTAPERLAEVNVQGSINVARAFRELRVSQKTMLFVSSAQVYQATQEGALSETSTLGPMTAYAHSKLASEHAMQIFLGPELDFYIVRPFNHIGPGQDESFLCPALLNRMREAKDGESIPVGNLELKRDFSDVRDIVRAYRLILEKKPAEKLFVLGSGIATPLSQIFAHLLKLSGKNLRAHTEAQYVRAFDPPLLLANVERARRVLGWECQFSLEQSLSDLYNGH